MLSLIHTARCILQKTFLLVWISIYFWMRLLACLLAFFVAIVGEGTSFVMSMNKSHQFGGGNLNPAGLFDGPPSLFDGSSNDDSIDLSVFQPDTDVKFISRLLLEEDMEDKIYMLRGDPALLAAVEKPFYDILNGNDYNSNDGFVNLESYTHPEDGGSVGDFSTSTGADGNYVTNNNNNNTNKQVIPEEGAAPSFYSYADRIAVSHSFDGDEHVWQFNKGVEEASKFLPHSSKLVIDVSSSASSESLDFVRNGSSQVVSETRRVKNLHDDDWQGGRRTKQSATSSGDQVPKEMYDELGLCYTGRKCGGRFIQNGIDEEEAKHESFKAAADGSGKSKGKKQTKKDAVDLRSLLILCAQSISTDDRLSANQQLRQIRQHSSSKGDGSQRLAHYFADGLEARLAGMGSEIYRSHMAKRMTSVSDILKAYRVYMRACPFKKSMHTFANLTILRATRHLSRIHIVDFGIGFGFQWPCFIQNLSSRPSGAPMLRITGIDLPQPGFRPSERLEETGRHLAEYAHEFNLPFEYNQIASKWEDVKVEDLNVREDEALFVVCTHMLESLADETVSLESPRDVLLKNIRKMNPSVFVHGIVNGAYSSPFFVTRFREALFHFSALFDAFDASMLCEDPDRQCLEREFFGQEVLNVIACEGTERVQRPETYRQWQARNQRCGFSQLPLDPEVLNMCREKIMPLYHKDYIIDVDGKWMLHGWKGRVLFAVSTWKPTGGV